MLSFWVFFCFALVSFRYLDLLNAAVALINLCYERKLTFLPKDVGQMLYGLHKLKCDRPVMHTLLTSLTDVVYSCPHRFESTSVCQSLYGLHGMSSEHAEKHWLLLNRNAGHSKSKH